MKPRMRCVPFLLLAVLVLLAASPAQGYVRLVSYNNLWQYGTTVSAYLASVVEFDTWCWYQSSWDCLEWYTAGVYGVLQRDGGTVDTGNDYQNYSYPAGVYLYNEIPPGGGNFYEASGVHEATWHGDYADGGANDYTWQMIYVQPTPPPPPSIYDMYPSEAERGSSGYLTISGQYLSYATNVNVSGTGVSMYVSAILSDSQIEAGYSVDANAGVGARSVSVTTSGGTSGGLTFNVTAPGGGGCGYERDTLIQEYATYNVNLTPECAWFTQSASSQYFTFSELHVNDFYSWALIRQPLVVNKSSGYGLDRWRELYGGPRTVNSGYRSPSKNASIAGAAQSRHMYGDAVDLANASHTRQEYDDMANAAKYGNPNAGASWVEDWSGPCGDGCVHADWRNAAGGYSQ